MRDLIDIVDINLTEANGQKVYLVFFTDLTLDINSYPILLGIYTKEHKAQQAIKKNISIQLSADHEFGHDHDYDSSELYREGSWIIKTTLNELVGLSIQGPPDHD